MIDLHQDLCLNIKKKKSQPCKLPSCNKKVESYMYMYSSHQTRDRSFPFYWFKKRNLVFLWKITLFQKFPEFTTINNQIVYASQILNWSKRLQMCTKNSGLPMLPMHYCRCKSLHKRKQGKTPNLHFKTNPENFGLFTRQVAYTSNKSYGCHIMFLINIQL